MTPTIVIIVAVGTGGAALCLFALGLIAAYRAGVVGACSGRQEFALGAAIMLICAIGLGTASAIFTALAASDVGA